jgi:hypothetical protein
LDDVSVAAPTGPRDVDRDGAGPCRLRLAFLRGANYLFALTTAAVIVVIAILALVVERTEWFDDLPHWLDRLLPVVPIVVFALAMLLGVVRKGPTKPKVTRKEPARPGAVRTG